jgi:hypothetical protein
MNYTSHTADSFIQKRKSAEPAGKREKKKGSLPFTSMNSSYKHNIQWHSIGMHASFTCPSETVS